MERVTQILPHNIEDDDSLDGRQLHVFTIHLQLDLFVKFFAHSPTQHLPQTDLHIDPWQEKFVNATKTVSLESNNRKVK